MGNFAKLSPFPAEANLVAAGSGKIETSPLPTTHPELYYGRLLIVSPAPDTISLIMNKPHSKYPHLFAIVRFDLPVDEQNPLNSISVVKAYSDPKVAESEAKRLRLLKDASKCQYEVLTTRLVR